MDYSISSLILTFKLKTPLKQYLCGISASFGSTIISMHFTWCTQYLSKYKVLAYIVKLLCLSFHHSISMVISCATGIYGHVMYIDCMPLNGSMDWTVWIYWHEFHTIYSALSILQHTSYSSPVRTRYGFLWRHGWFIYICYLWWCALLCQFRWCYIASG